MNLKRCKFYKQLKSGSGIYVENETKVGFWNDLHEYFCDTYQIIFSGEYKNGIKIGKFDIEFKKQYENEYKKIGGGIDQFEVKIRDNIYLKHNNWIMYTFDENGLKDGQWIDLSNNFCFFQFDTCIKQYKKGRKTKIDDQKQ